MIVFEKIKWKNLLSTGNVFTEMSLNTHKSTMICGENAAGKSSFLDALSFALFGKPFRKINKPQLINSITQKNLVVEVEFDISGARYKVVRGLKPAVFEVYKNGVLLNQSAEMKDYQEILEKQILKVNHKSFCQVVILGAATFQQFMQLTTGQRREIIEDLLDLQIFTTMNSLLKDKVQINNESVLEASNKKKLLSDKIELIQDHLSELHTNNEKIKEEKKSIITETKAQVILITSEIDTIEKEKAEFFSKIEEEPVLLSKHKKLLDYKSKIEANLAVLTKDVSFFHKYDNCPTCKQQIEENFRKDTVSSKQAEIDKLNNGLVKLKEETNKLEEKLSEIAKIKSKITDLRMEIHLKQTKINSLNQYISSLEKEILSIETQFSNKSENKIPELEQELKETEVIYYDLVEEKNVLSVASTLLKDSGIKSKIVKQYIPIINKLINKYLSSMEFMCQFELDEQFNETIKSRYRDEFSYSSFSEGEKTRIDLAILFTWRAIAKMRNSINTNLLIMDEILDSSLDSNGIEEFLKIINNLTLDTNTFIISHKSDQLYDKFDKVIRFEKHKSFSRIVE